MPNSPLITFVDFSKELLFVLVERPIFEGIRLDAVQSRSPWARLLAECVSECFGTAILVLVGCSGVAQFVLSRGALSSFLSVNFAFGFGAMIAVFVSGPVSGKGVFHLFCFIAMIPLCLIDG